MGPRQQKGVVLSYAQSGLDLNRGTAMLWRLNGKEEHLHADWLRGLETCQSETLRDGAASGFLGWEMRSDGDHSGGRQGYGGPSQGLKPLNSRNLPARCDWTCELD